MLFLGGYRSDMTGSKALKLEEWARNNGRACLCFDHFGHGDSSGHVYEGTIGRWRDDALAMFDAQTDGPQIVVGSSLGGWLSLLVAIARPERVAGVVLIAPAPDFTQELIWDKLDPDRRAEVIRTGWFEEHSPYSLEPDRFSLRLFEEARGHLLLAHPVEIAAPVRILHGTDDTVVPWQLSSRLLERLTGADATLTLVKGGDHRLSGAPDLERLIQAVDGLSVPPEPLRAPGDSSGSVG